MFYKNLQGRRSNVRAKGQSFGGGYLSSLTSNDLRCKFTARRKAVPTFFEVGGGGGVSKATKALGDANFNLDCALKLTL